MAIPDLTAWYAEAETKLKAGVAGLRVFQWGEKPQVPAASLLLPEDIARTQYRGGWKTSDVQVVLLVERGVSRTSRPKLFAYVAAASAALDPQTWTSVSDVTLTNITFGTVTFAGATDEYLGAVLHLDVSGA